MDEIQSEENKFSKKAQTPKSVIITIVAVVIGSIFGGYVYDAVLKEAIFGPELKPYREITYDDPIEDDGEVMSADADGWVMYRTQDRGFEVLFPSQPEYQMASQLVAGTDVTLNVHIYRSEAKNLIYMVGATTVPVDDIEPIVWGRSDLDNMVEGVLGNLPYARVTGKEYIDFNGIEAVDLKLVDDKLGYHLRHLMLGYDDTTYSLGAVSEEGVIPEEDFNKFTGSFRLLNQDPVE